MKLLSGSSIFRSKKTNRLRGIGAYSLIEVMIAACMFTLLAVSTTTLFVQNQRMIMLMRFRTHVTNAALNIMEQLRVKEYTTLKDLHDSAALGTSTTATILVALADPNYPAPTPPAVSPVEDGYRPIYLNLNVVDGTQKNDNWTYCDLPLDETPTAPKITSRFWVTLNSNVSTSAPIVEALELCVLYQWKNPSEISSTNWQSGTIRIAVPRPSPK